MKKGFYVPAGFFDCSFISSMLDNAVFLTILFFARKGIRSIPYKTFMSNLKVGRNSISKSLNKLKEAGYISYSVGPRRINEFKISFKPIADFKGNVDASKYSKVDVPWSIVDDFLSGPKERVRKAEKTCRKAQRSRLTYRQKMMLVDKSVNFERNKRAGKGMVSFGPKVEQTAKVFGKSERSVRRYLLSLKENKFLRRVRKKYDMNRYFYVEKAVRGRKNKRTRGNKEGGQGKLYCGEIQAKRPKSFAPEKKPYSFYGIRDENGGSGGGAVSDRFNSVLDRLKSDVIHPAVLKYRMENGIK